MVKPTNNEFTPFLLKLRAGPNQHPFERINQECSEWIPAHTKIESIFIQTEDGRIDLTPRNALETLMSHKPEEVFVYCTGDWTAIYKRRVFARIVDAIIEHPLVVSP